MLYSKLYKTDNKAYNKKFNKDKANNKSWMELNLNLLNNKLKSNNKSPRTNRNSKLPSTP